MLSRGLGLYYLCKSVFHGTCGTSNEEKVGTKTMVNNFNKTSTKSNFLFLCDCCLTKFEADQVKTQNDRLDNLEKQLSEIKSLLKESRNPPALVSDPSPIPNKPDKNNSFASKMLVTSVLPTRDPINLETREFIYFDKRTGQQNQLRFLCFVYHESYLEGDMTPKRWCRNQIRVLKQTFKTITNLTFGGVASSKG